MPDAAANSAALAALLQQPGLWRGRDAARHDTFPTGFAALDERLPGAGWPQRGLIEVLTPGNGHGELALWMPLVARLTQLTMARWCAVIAPPFNLHAPAWQARGVRLERLLIARTESPAWALEQSLRSGACALVFGWLTRASMRELQRLKLAAEKGAALGVIFRPLAAAQAHSTATLRLTLRQHQGRVQLHWFKGLGLAPGSVDLVL